MLKNTTPALWATQAGWLVDLMLRPCSARARVSHAPPGVPTLSHSQHTQSQEEGRRGPGAYLFWFMEATWSHSLVLGL